MKEEFYKIALLSDIPKDNIFRVPDAYFERFLQRLQDRCVLSLNEALQQRPFECPEKYFDTLHEQINQKVDFNEGLDAMVHKGSPFNVPEQYFEKLSAELTEKALPTNVEAPLALPEGYFDTLEAKIHGRIEGEPSIKVVPLYPKVIQYIAAASMVVFLALVLYFYRHQDVEQRSIVSHRSNIDLANTLIASLSEQEVRQYLELEDIENQDLLEYTSSVKKQKIQEAFEKEILPVKIKKQERQDMELELDNIDISDITSDI